MQESGVYVDAGYISKFHIPMKVLAAVNLSTDIPYWIRREDFQIYFDQNDFQNRNVTNIQQAYLKDWFYKDAAGADHFFIPVSGAIGNRTDLIGSRHRLAVLLPYLAELPIAIATAYLTPAARKYLDTIPKRPFDTSAFFWIPDLPIHELLPCPTQ